MNKLPRNSGELIKELDKNEGPLRVTPKQSAAEIMFRAGRRAIIDELLVKLAASGDDDAFQVLGSDE